MLSVKSVAVATALRKGPWEDRFGLQTSCVSPVCVGVCARSDSRCVCDCVGERLHGCICRHVSWLFVNYFHQLFMPVADCVNLCEAATAGHISA